MKQSKYLSRAEFKEKMEREREREKEKEKKKEEDNEENEEEEEEEDDDKNKQNEQKQKPIQSSTRPIINKDIKTSIKKDEKPPVMSSHTFNRRILHTRNLENNVKEGSNNASKDPQDKDKEKDKNPTQNIPTNSRIIIKRDSLRTNQSHPYTLKMIQNSSRSHLLKTQIPSNNSSQAQTQSQTHLKTQNSQSNMLRPQIPSKIESQTQATQNNRYTRRRKHYR